MDPAGWLIAASVAIALVTGFFLRTRAPAWLVTELLSLSGVGIGAGGMLYQTGPSIGEFAAAVVALAILVPLHVRLVLGPFGPAARGKPWAGSAPAERPADRPGL
ncbi:MAG: hypothetical protein ACRDH8_14445 [Actinomycetota bacterium]